jgi:hypothetical protein
MVIHLEPDDSGANGGREADNAVLVLAVLRPLVVSQFEIRRT